MADAVPRTRVGYSFPSPFSFFLCDIPDQKHGFAGVKASIFLGQRSTPVLFSVATQLLDRSRELAQKNSLSLVSSSGKSKKQSECLATGDRLLQLLEMRLDNVLYRAGFALTRMQARQFVGHKHFLLNGKRADSPSLLVKAGDTITVRDRFATNSIFSDLKNRLKLAPKWLKIDEKKKAIMIDRIPEIDECEATIAVSLIVEFYSR